MFCTIGELANESDVEQKFILPLLTTSPPTGLGYGSIDFRTKPDIRRLKLDKGKAEKLYHPDYAIVIAGIPVFIIEAKRPDEDLVEALREARLYAIELNASFPPHVNPCQRVVASNGILTVSAPVDSATPDLTLSLEDCSPSNPAYEEFVIRLSRKAAQTEADKIRDSLTIRPLHRAIQSLGGRSSRDEDVGYNDFGSKLAIDYRHVFNPESRKDRAHIVRNAYVPSQRREHYVDEIDRIIKTAVSISVPGARLIQDTEKPDEIISALRAGRSLENEIMLLVGARGAGKSTFIDYCREVQLPDDVIASTEWVHLNLNDAPSDREMIERWLLDETIAALRREHTDIDFDADIQKVFSVEVNKLKRGPLAVLDPESEAFKTRLADQLLLLQNDRLAHAKAMARYLAAERRKLLVVVFDNCDKRVRDEQLQAFQSARWLQQQIRCLVVLPIRDVTYELYKEEPPLDTMIKDLVFRIDPPSFTRILKKRLDLVLNELAANTQAKMLEYTLDNGIPVRYPATEIGFYLASIFRSLYDYDKLIRSLILGLAGRDIRRAMEIFLEFCRSGHIGAAEYLKIRTLKGQYSLPYTVVSRVLLRRNRRFYDGDSSFLKNLFQCDPEDSRPDVFVRADILEWLRTKHREVGPTGVRGFHQCRILISELMPLGHEAGRVRAELDYLVKHGCIIAEHQRRKIDSDDDLVRLSPSGFVHLSLVSDISYLAACVEEAWVEDEALARRVADRIAPFGPKVHFSPLTVAANASEFVDYLARQQSQKLSPRQYLEGGFSGVELDTDAVVERAKRAIAKERKSRGWDAFDDRFCVGMECSGTVDGIQEYGVFVRLDGGPTGLIYFRNLPSERPVTSFEQGDRITVEILDVQLETQKVSLRFIGEEGNTV